MNDKPQSERKPILEEQTAQADAENRIKQSAGETDGHEHSGRFGEFAELIFAAICGGLLLVGWLLATFTNISPWYPSCIYLAAYFFGGFFTFREALSNIL